MFWRRCGVISKNAVFTADLSRLISTDRVGIRPVKYRLGPRTGETPAPLFRQTQHMLETATQVTPMVNGVAPYTSAVISGEVTRIRWSLGSTP